MSLVRPDSNKNKGHTERVEAQARSWAVYLHSGDATADKLAEFEAWLAADADHAIAYHDYEQIMMDLGMPCGAPEGAQSGPSEPAFLTDSAPKRSSFTFRSLTGGVMAAAFALVGRYEAAFWWAKPAMLLEKALVAVAVLSLEGRRRLWLSLGLAGASFAWVAATRPYLGVAEDRTDVFSRLSNLFMVCVGAAMETAWITKETGKYALAANSLVAAVVFTIRCVREPTVFLALSVSPLLRPYKHAAC